MTDRERKLGFGGVMRHNLGMPLVARSEPLRHTRAEVTKWLRQTTTDPWYDNISPVPVGTKMFAVLCGYTTENTSLKKAIVSERDHNGVYFLSANHVATLGGLMDDIESGRLVFWPIKIQRMGRPPYQPFYLERPPALYHTRQSAIVDRGHYDWWGTCCRCNGRRFAPARVSGRSSLLCWNCIPPSTYGTIAADALDLPLIPDVIKRWGVRQEEAV